MIIKMDIILPKYNNILELYYVLKNQAVRNYQTAQTSESGGINCYVFVKS
jgi:hypothetical protein